MYVWNLNNNKKNMYQDPFVAHALCNSEILISACYFK